MGLFSRKKRQEDEVPQLPKLPELPELPQEEKKLGEPTDQLLWGCKNTLTFHHKGIIHECNGEKVENGIILQADSYKMLLDFLRKEKIPVKIRKL